jgi:hypothetical protein
MGGTVIETESEKLIRKGKEEEAIANAKMLFKNGVSMELVAASITTLSKEKLQKIYEEVR